MLKTRLFILLMMLLSCMQVSATNLKIFKGDDQVPALQLQDLQGKVHNLNDYKGQVVLLQFWATYCPPCRKEMPSMNNLQKKMADVPFKILAVDMGESRAEVDEFISQVKPEFTILMDPEGESIAAWKVYAAPSNFIIDTQGKIRYTLYGGVEWDSPEMVKQLKALVVTQ
ncbi:MAG: TlpA family protein disulfide reductase [Gammaproteobacteria bacterium]|nr:TlpA family protein disulfide reductase [Gammaproteobacteria bacterium]